MSDLLLRQQPTARRRGVVLQAIVGGLVLLASFVGVARVTALPPRVDELRLVNPHPYHVTVEVAGEDDDGWLAVGTVERDQSETFEDVIDQGPRWRARFSYAGVDADEITISRRDLETDGWRLTIPPTVGERLREAGLQPSG
jgi:hypothetical protein